jgi:hypothetical protein
MATAAASAACSQEHTHKENKRRHSAWPISSRQTTAPHTAPGSSQHHIKNKHMATPSWRQQPHERKNHPAQDKAIVWQHTCTAWAADGLISFVKTRSALQTADDQPPALHRIQASTTPSTTAHGHLRQPQASICTAQDKATRVATQKHSKKAC